MSEQETPRSADDLPFLPDELTSARSRFSPEKVHVLPVYQRPVFPEQDIFCKFDAKRYKKTLKHVFKTKERCVALFFIDAPEKTGAPLDIQQLPEFGTLARIVNIKEDENTLVCLVRGIKRVNIKRWIKQKSLYVIEPEYPITPEDNSPELTAHAQALEYALNELTRIKPFSTPELKEHLLSFNARNPDALIDAASPFCKGPNQTLQTILDCLPLLPRIQKVLPLLKEALNVHKLRNEIIKGVNRKLDRRQYEFLLREQLKLIQKKLGNDPVEKDIKQFRARLKSKQVPKPIKAKIKDEIRKLSTLDKRSPDYTITHNYLEHVTNIPWGIYGQDNLDLNHARVVLNQHHAGMDDIKNRILEFLAVGAFKGEMSGSIVLLIGPPGVGKTSVGKSIAESLGRPFYRLSLGGMRDEAEIKGHRRTYIGAMPGKLVQAISDVGVMNPVIMLDEIDKMGSSYQGDPAAALLETLDPEQNADFLDHYLDVRLDLSKVLFVCTANSLDGIPSALLDRMEVIRLAGYITEEKVSIARHHLWPRLLEKAGVPSSRLDLNDSTLRALIEGYARESGVRQLEKQLGKIIRKAVVKLIDAPTSKIKIRNKDLEAYLGMPPFRKERALQGVGIITGLAWTSMGGATLPIEATRVHCLNRGLKLTGKLGDVMKESAEIALSYISAHLAAYGAPTGFFDQAFVHVHVPEGGIPKDGPSAGVTIASALLSLARNQPAKKNVAMTGELTLTGQVLAIGGVREKVIAARRQKISELILPDANQGDFDELPDYLKEGLTVHFVEHFRDVVGVLFPVA